MTLIDAIDPIIKLGTTSMKVEEFLKQQQDSGFEIVATIARSRRL